MIGSFIAAVALVSFALVADEIWQEGGLDRGVAVAIVAGAAAINLGVAALVWVGRPREGLLLASALATISVVLFLYLLLWWPTTIVALAGSGVAVKVDQRRRRRAQAGSRAEAPRPPRPQAVPPAPR